MVYSTFSPIFRGQPATIEPPFATAALMSSADCSAVSDARRSKIWASASASMAAVGSSRMSLEAKGLGVHEKTAGFWCHEKSAKGLEMMGLTWFNPWKMMSWLWEHGWNMGSWPTKISFETTKRLAKGLDMIRLSDGNWWVNYGKMMSQIFNIGNSAVKHGLTKKRVLEMVG